MNITHRQLENWPCKGFLAIADVFSADELKTLQDFDFSPYGKITFPGRMHYAFNLEEDRLPESIYEILKKFHAAFHNTEMLEYLTKSSIEDSMDIKKAWLGGFEKMNELFKAGYISIWQDTEEFDLGIHRDSNEILAVMQVYLSPTNGDVGTRFHDLWNLKAYKQLPYVANTGYFLLNSSEGFHSAVNAKGVKRKSMSFVWTI